MNPYFNSTYETNHHHFKCPPFLSWKLLPGAKFIEKYKNQQLKNKANNAELPGILMVSIGGGLLFASVPLMLSENPTNPDNQDTRRLHVTGAILAGAGILLGVSSIPFWIKGHRIMREANKKIRFRMRSSTMRLTKNQSTYITTRQFAFCY